MGAGMTTWWISDTHFFHANIIKYCGRPFKNLEEMNFKLIRNWNERVKPEDTVFIIGDFIFTNSPGGKPGEGEHVSVKTLLLKLNGNKIFLEGNHDSTNMVTNHIQKIVIDYGGQKMNMVHDPEHADYRYPINLVGHVHEKWQIRRYRNGELFTDCINCGVDVWGFAPVNWREINKRYSKWLKVYGKFENFSN